MCKSGWLISALFALVSTGFVAAGESKGDTSKGDASPAKKLAELNSLTGELALEGALKDLMADKEQVRSLIKQAKEKAKDKKSPLSYNAARVLARAAADLKDYKSSEFFYRLCMEDALKLLSTQRLLESYGELIDVLYDNKMYPEAIALSQELLELKSDRPGEFYLVQNTRSGEMYMERHAGYDFASRLRPAVHRLLIQALAKQGKYEQALKLVDNLIMARDHWREHQLRGWVLREAGQYAEAAKVYEDVLDQIQKDRMMDPEERELYEERGRYVLSNVYIDMRKVDKATEQLQILLKSKPDEPGYNNDLGYIWADHNMNLEEAEKLIRKALELDRKRRKASPEPMAEDRDNGAYLDSLGWVLHKQKKNKEALEVLLKAVEDKAAQHIEIYDHLGDVYFELGNREKALEAWRQGLKLVGEGRREAERKELVERKIEKHAK